MRYSVLAYLAGMGRTLMEAAAYLETAPADDAVCPELLENGRRMLGQIRETLEGCQADLLSIHPMQYLSQAEALWGTDGAACGSVLKAFTDGLPDWVRCQVRAVFFAGLGSAWDAMESVYRYMRDDPRFDPVVVLIPIVRQMERRGQTVQEVIYEDYLTPLGIPFLKYDAYQPETDCPELAFINQPYEGTTVTEFWPKSIAQYTRLVYLPYFLTDLVEYKTPEYLGQAPVNRYAWKVVCSNQKEYQYYCRHAANGGINGILTGIPKLDPLVSLPQRGIALPAGWECLRGKKVFLWNSWYIFPFSSIRWFDGITAWFREHTDCALIWRPHPMTEVITRMHQAKQYPVWQAYLQQILDMPNAVLDQQPSCEAAFYYSHALISDYSSLLPQYLLMDKPALCIKNDIWKFTGEEFIDSSWMEQTRTADGVLDFLDRVSGGEDPNAAARGRIRRQDLPLADGHCGERVCETLWQAMRQEDFSA